MPSLKAIRKRIQSVQSTQKITRAMKMVAGARLNRAQTRITELRPYAVKTQQVLSAITVAPSTPAMDEGGGGASPALLAARAGESVSAEYARIVSNRRGCTASAELYGSR